MTYALSYDLGTGGIKAALVGLDGTMPSTAFVEYETRTAGANIREQRPQDWFSALCEATQELKIPAGIKIAAIGISGHSLGVVALTSSGELIDEFTPIWSDSRAKAEADDFFRRVDYEKWYRETGCGQSPEVYSVFKLMWYRAHRPELYEAAAVFLGTKDYLNYRLCGTLATDRSYASGSGVWSIKKEAYSPEYIAAAGLDAAKLPDILPSDTVIGTLAPEIAMTLGLTPGIPVVAGAVDNAAMAYGAGCYRDGDCYASLGSSAWIALSARRENINFSAHPFVFAHCLPGLFVPSVGILASGSSLRWLRNTLFPNLGYAELDRLAASSPVGANNLLFCPALNGGNSTDAAFGMRGGFSGLDLSHTFADIVRAVLEGAAMQLRCARDAFIPAEALSDSILMVGGGATSPLWRQIYADVFAQTVKISRVNQSAAALGAAALAFRGADFDDDVIAAAHGEYLPTAPSPQNTALYSKLLPAFRQLCASEATIYGILHGRT